MPTPSQAPAPTADATTCERPAAPAGSRAAGGLMARLTPLAALLTGRRPRPPRPSARRYALYPDTH